ncbi:MAG TPA: mechanosensitive ion channel domain-containing protein [Thermomicrobiales bacterium]|jgi:small-conductance mechanosensitive channel
MQLLREFWDSFRAGLLSGLPGGNDLARFLIQLLKIVIIGAITLTVARRVKIWSGRLLGRARVAPNVIALLGNAGFALALLFGISWLLAALGANWTAVLASLSAITVALGLALQDVLKNFVAGIYILLEQPFKIGDRIMIKTVSGEVEGVDIRTTTLRTEEGLRVIVPNNVVLTEIVTNHSAYDTRLVALQLADARVSFQDINRLVHEALAPFPEIVQVPAPRVTIQKATEEQATIGLEYWQRGEGAALPDVIDRLNDVFPDATITVTTADGIKVGAA